MEVQEIDDVAIIGTEDRLDAFYGTKLRDLVMELAQGRGLNLVIDMDKTIFIDSKGCGHLVSLLRVLTKHRRDIKIARPTPEVSEILRFSRLDRVFKIYDSVDSAVESSQ